VVENSRLLSILTWVLNYSKWRLLGLRLPTPGKDIPRIWKGARIVHPERVTLGPLVQLRPFSVVRGVPGRIAIGAHTGIGDYTIVNAVESIEIGSRVMVAAHCLITDADHDMEGRGAMQTQGRTAKPVVIEDEAWIASGVTITAGVRIGRGAVVGAGAVVTRSVEPFAIVAGVPARKIGSR
jgi:acetyltransferase-like isoleucine patch superfamily enzyme